MIADAVGTLVHLVRRDLVGALLSVWPRVVAFRLISSTSSDRTESALGRISAAYNSSAQL